MAAFSVRRRKANKHTWSGGVREVLDMEHPELSVSKQYVETNYSVIGQVLGHIGSPKRSILLPDLLKKINI
jgi:hypothetical protein